MTRFRPMLARLDDRIVPTTLPNGFAEAQLAAGLDQPTGMVVAPDGRVFVTEQTGDVRIIKNGSLLGTPFLTLGVDGMGERGLLGIALDPNFESNGFVYVYYTVRANGPAPAHNRISRFTARGDVASPGEMVLLDLDPLSSATNHNGGGLQFGSDGKLYVGVGDNANGANSQTANSLLGKILRLNPDGSIPADNPSGFAGIGEAPTGKDRAIWAVGLRNPFALAMQPGTGRIFINDVGAAAFEEIDQGKVGANYGWPATEGDFDQARFPAYTQPVYSYPHGTGTPLVGEAITGGTFYNPSTVSFPTEYVGDYFFTDLGGGWINRLDPQTHAVTNFASDLTGQSPVALAVDTQGNLLYLAHGNGAGQGSLFAIKPVARGPVASGFASANTPIVAAGAGAGGGSVVAVYNAATGQETGRFFTFESAFTGGVRVAKGDVTGDGVPDLVAGAGPGDGPRVTVYNGQTGNPARDFFAFEPTFTGGVYVGTADFNRDGFADVIVAADVGGGPRVRIFNGQTGTTIADFFAFETSFTGGVRVAAGDVNGDGVPDLVVSAGYGGGPRIAVFNGRDIAAGLPMPGRVGADFFAFESSLRNGAFVTAADLNGDGKADIITGAGPGGGPRVTGFSGSSFLAGQQTVLTDFFAGDTANRNGVTVAVADADGDGKPDIFTGANGRVAAFRVVSGPPVGIREFTPFADFAGGVFVG